MILSMNLLWNCSETAEIDQKLLWNCSETALELLKLPWNCSETTEIDQKLLWNCSRAAEIALKLLWNYWNWSETALKYEIYNNIKIKKKKIEIIEYSLSGWILAGKFPMSKSLATGYSTWGRHGRSSSSGTWVSFQRPDFTFDLLTTPISRPYLPCSHHMHS